MVTAFVLITAESGSETEVMKELTKIGEVKEAHLVYGAYDIIARIEEDNMAGLKDVISRKVRHISKIRSTLTMMTI